MTNLAESPFSFDVEDVIFAFKKVFQLYCRSFRLKDPHLEEWESRHLLDKATLLKFKAPQWIWGETPPFSWQWGPCTLSFGRGRMKQALGPHASQLNFLKDLPPWRLSPDLDKKFNNLARFFDQNRLNQLKSFFALSLSKRETLQWNFSRAH